MAGEQTTLGTGANETDDENTEYEPAPMPPITAILVRTGMVSETRLPPNSDTGIVQVMHEPIDEMWAIGQVLPGTDKVLQTTIANNRIVGIPGTEGTQAVRIEAFARQEDGAIRVFGRHVPNSENSKRGREVIIELAPDLIKNVTWLCSRDEYEDLLADATDAGEDEGDETEPPVLDLPASPALTNGTAQAQPQAPVPAPQVPGTSAS
jgi:hypothetical protein